LWLGNDEHLYRAATRQHKSDGPFTAKSAEKFVRGVMPGGTPDMRSPRSHREPSRMTSMKIGAGSES
jgi:hypothetical protein